jgi:hypothetical protein
MSTTPENPDVPFTNEEIVFLIKAMIASLRAPGWTFKNRKDLEKIGEVVIFGGKELRDLDDALYDRIFPHLKTMAVHLGKILRDTAPDEPKTAAPSTASPASPTSPVPAPAPTPKVASAPPAKKPKPSRPVVTIVEEPKPETQGSPTLGSPTQGSPTQGSPTLGSEGHEPVLTAVPTAKEGA